MHRVSRFVAKKESTPFPYALPLPLGSVGDEREYALSHCVSMARHSGCLVEVLPRTKVGDRRFLREILLINGRRCSFQNPANLITNKLARRPYSKVMVTFSTLCLVDFAIFLTTVDNMAPRAFVLPKEVLLRAYFDPAREHVMLWLPVMPLPDYHNMHSKIPYWNYERAWPTAS